MPEITRITKTFEYDMPDAYLYQTNALNKKGTFTKVLDIYGFLLMLKQEKLEVSSTTLKLTTVRLSQLLQDKLKSWLTRT